MPIYDTGSVTISYIIPRRSTKHPTNHFSGTLKAPLKAQKQLSDLSNIFTAIYDNNTHHKEEICFHKDEIKAQLLAYVVLLVSHSS